MTEWNGFRSRNSWEVNLWFCKNDIEIKHLDYYLRWTVCESYPAKSKKEIVQLATDRIFPNYESRKIGKWRITRRAIQDMVEHCLSWISD